MSRAGAYVLETTGAKTILPETGRDRLAWLFIAPLTSRLGSVVTKGLLNRILRVQYDYSKLNIVDEFFAGRPEQVRIETSRVVATYWPTAYFVRAYASKRQCQAYYLIQNKEDDPSLSGRLSDLAAATYKFDLTKIVLSERDRARFGSENPAVIPIGFDGSKFRLLVPLESRSGNCVLVPLRAGKGWEYGLTALQKVHLRMPSIRMIAFGNIPRRLVPNYVEYHLTPSDSVLSKLYNTSTIFVLPSVFEGSSATVLEAMASGNAIIATDSGNDYLDDGSNALVVPSKDSAALASAMIRLVGDDATRSALQNASLKFAAGRSGYDEMVSRFLEITRCPAEPSRQ